MRLVVSVPQYLSIAPGFLLPSAFRLPNSISNSPVSRTYINAEFIYFRLLYCTRRIYVTVDRTSLRSDRTIE